MARPPTLMKMRGALSCSSPTRMTSGASKRAWPLDHRAAGHRAQPALDPVARFADDGVGAGAHARHVDADRPGDHAEVGAAAREVRGVGAGDHGLGRRAAGVHAGAAEQVSLDQRDGHARAGQPSGQRRTGLAGAHDDRIELVHATGHANHDRAAPPWLLRSTDRKIPIPERRHVGPLRTAPIPTR